MLANTLAVISRRQKPKNGNAISKQVILRSTDYDLLEGTGPPEG
jgi:hypothetical protein